MRLNFGSGLQLVLPVRYHLLAGRESGIYGDQVSVRHSDIDLPNLCGAVIAHYKYEGTLRTALDCSRRNHDRTLFNVEKQASVNELIRPEQAVFVVEDSLQLHSTGGLVDLVVNRRQGSAGQFG